MEWGLRQVWGIQATSIDYRWGGGRGRKGSVGRTPWKTQNKNGDGKEMEPSHVNRPSASSSYYRKILLRRNQGKIFLTKKNENKKIIPTDWVHDPMSFSFFVFSSSWFRREESNETSSHGHTISSSTSYWLHEDRDRPSWEFCKESWQFPFWKQMLPWGKPPPETNHFHWHKLNMWDRFQRRHDFSIHYFQMGTHFSEEIKTGDENGSTLQPDFFAFLFFKLTVADGKGNFEISWKQIVKRRERSRNLRETNFLRMTHHRQ